MGGTMLLLSLLCTVYSVAQMIPLSDYHATGESAAMFGEDEHVRIEIETTTEEPATTTSTVTPTTSLVGIVPVNQTIRVADEMPMNNIAGTAPNDVQPLGDLIEEGTTQPPPPPPPPQPQQPSSNGYDVPSTASSGSNFIPPAPEPPLSDFPFTTTEVPPPPPPPISNPSVPSPSQPQHPSPSTPASNPAQPSAPTTTPPPRPTPPTPVQPSPHTTTRPPPVTTQPPSTRPTTHPTPNDGDSPPNVPDLLFLVDASGSMKSAWKQHLQCVLTIARPVVGKAKIGVIVYSSKYKHRLYIPFAHYDAGTLNSLIQALPFHGGVTNTGEALNEAVRVLQRERPRQVAVITLTDGYSWDALDRGSAQIRAIPGTTTYAVALEDIVLRSELQVLAGSPERVFMQPDCCERLAERLNSGFRKSTVTEFPSEITTTWYPVTPPPQSSNRYSNRYSSATIGNEDETHAHFDDRLFTVDGTASDPSFSDSDGTIARFDSEFSPVSPPQTSNYRDRQHNYLPIPRRDGSEQCSLDVVFAFDSTSHAGLPSLLAASQKLLHSRVFKKRTVRIGAVKFSDASDSRIVFPLDEASHVSIESILRMDSHRGVEQALLLAAGLLRDAVQVRPTKRVVFVLSDVFDSHSAQRALSSLQSLDASVFVLHSTSMTTVSSHSFPGAAGLTTSVVSDEDISKVEEEVENLANACSRRM